MLCKFEKLRKGPKKKKQQIRKEKQSSFLAFSFAGVASIKQVIELQSIWHVKQRNSEKVKEYKLSFITDYTLVYSISTSK